MSLLSERRSTALYNSVVDCAEVVCGTFIETNPLFSGVSKTATVKLDPLHSFFMDNNQVTFAEPVQLVSSAATVSGAGTLSFPFNVNGTATLVIPDTVNTTYPHVLRFTQGLLSSYNLFDLDITVDTSKPGVTGNTSFRLPLVAPGGTGDYDFTVYWGEPGQSTVITNTSVVTDYTHTYSTSGTYTIKIVGKLQGWVFGLPANQSDAQKLLLINDWYDGFQMGTSEGYYFSRCYNLNILAPRPPNLKNVVNMDFAFYMTESMAEGTTVHDFSKWDVSDVTSMQAMFSKSVFNFDISTWDVSQVTNMASFLEQNSVFNQPLNTWDVSKVKNMEYMFSEAYAFNQPLDKWNTGSVLSMESTLYYCELFNQNIDSWDVSQVQNFYYFMSDCYEFNQPLNSWDVRAAVTMDSMLQYTRFNRPLNKWDTRNVQTMYQMFVSCPFDQNINNWNVSKVLDLEYCFYECADFNQPLDKWDVSNCLNLSNMFEYAYTFNQPLDAWDVSSVNNFAGLFAFTKFNHPLSSWDTAQGNDMSSMFIGTPFNQALDMWSVSNVIAMGYMFADNTVFNQNLNSWNVENNLVFEHMFDGCTSFKQTLSGWFPRNAQSFTFFLHNADINEAGSTANYDALLNSWGLPPKIDYLPSNLDFTANLCYYNDDVSGVAHDQLQTAKNWTISDSGPVV